MQARAQSPSVAVCAAEHPRPRGPSLKGPMSCARWAGRVCLCLAVPQWMQRRADCACARAGVAGPSNSRSPHTHALEGRKGVSSVRQRRGVQRARPVEVPRGARNESPPLRGAAGIPPPHTS